MGSLHNLLALKVKYFSLFDIRYNLTLSPTLTRILLSLIRNPDNTTICRYADNIILLFPGYAGSPAQFAVTRCVDGFWSPYSLHCSPHDCGPVATSPGLALTVSYPDNTTQFGSQARLSCSLGEIHKETSLTCTKVRPLCSVQVHR